MGIAGHIECIKNRTAFCDCQHCRVGKRTRSGAGMTLPVTPNQKAYLVEINGRFYTGMSRAGHLLTSDTLASVHLFSNVMAAYTIRGLAIMKGRAAKVRGVKA